MYICTAIFFYICTLSCSNKLGTVLKSSFQYVCFFCSDFARVTFSARGVAFVFVYKREKKAEKQQQKCQERREREGREV